MTLRHRSTQALQQLKDRQQTLLNLISNVGGKNNIRKWVDELMVIEAKIEELAVRLRSLTKAEVIEIKYDESDFNYTTPWVAVVKGQVVRFPTRAQGDRYLSRVGLQAA